MNSSANFCNNSLADKSLTLLKFVPAQRFINSPLFLFLETFLNGVVTEFCIGNGKFFFHSFLQ